MLNGQTDGDTVLYNFELYPVNGPLILSVIDGDSYIHKVRWSLIHYIRSLSDPKWQKN